MISTTPPRTAARASSGVICGLTDSVSVTLRNSAIRSRLRRAPLTSAARRRHSSASVVPMRADAGLTVDAQHVAADHRPADDDFRAGMRLPRQEFVVDLAPDGAVLHHEPPLALVVLVGRGQGFLDPVQLLRLLAGVEDGERRQLEAERLLARRAALLAIERHQVAV